MELVEGDELSLLRHARAPCAVVPDTLAIARRIADALEAAHDQGIVARRHLKPQHSPEVTVDLVAALNPATGGGGAYYRAGQLPDADRRPPKWGSSSGRLRT